MSNVSLMGLKIILKVLLQKIAKKLGYDWKFVKINQKVSRSFFTSKTFTKYLKWQTTE